MQRKIQSVLELARYKVGDVAWWVVLRYAKEVPVISEEDGWMTEHHPKALYSRGPYKSLWNSNIRLPHVHQSDFLKLVGLMTSKLVTEQFIVCDLVRSRDTGEFFYSNADNEWMPESYLFDTNAAARREQARLLKMMKNWVKNN